MFFVFQKFCFKYLKRSKFPLILTYKDADPSNGGLFRKFPESRFGRIYALPAGFKMGPLRNSVSL